MIKYYTPVCVLCLFIFLLTSCYPLGMLLLGGDNYIGKVKLSKGEKMMEKKLSKDCECTVSIKHNIFLVKGMLGNYKPTAQDSVCNVVFEWDATRKDYDSTEDLSNKGREYLSNYVNTFMPDVLKVLSYKQYYRAINVSFRTEHFYQYDGKIIQGAHNKPMMDYSEQYVSYNIGLGRIE